MSKKIYALLLAAVMVLSVFAFAGCNETTENSSEAGGEETNDFKVGFIFLHDENSTYDKNFMDAAREAQTALGLTDEQVIFKVNIPESSACYDAACELVDEGCDLIFADSFGHEAFIFQAAQEFPEVQFCHATGTSAHVKKLANFHNAFASIYEGRYVAGIAAGMKLNEMIAAGKITAEQAVIGYVGAFDYAEVVSGMTSFFLGARSVCESATMKVKYTNSWFDIALEREAALALIDSGCVLISQHADSEGAPKACEERKIPNVAYNISTISMGPTTAIISSKIDWTPYFKLIIEKTKSGKGNEIPFDWCGGFNEGSVKVTELNTAVAAEGTQAALDKAIADFKAGTLKVFDTSKFTVNGETLTEYLADVDGDFTGETNVIHDGFFDESAKDQRSAPYFDIKYIDGISAL
ncbi:MAG: BMP family ABC transporter substrate-binding protein [Clostridia bacterium]|nr:BMP family ABC transporter substrate-binding protein [Clostridia bacterium]